MVTLIKYFCYNFPVQKQFRFLNGAPIPTLTHPPTNIVIAVVSKRIGAFLYQQLDGILCSFSCSCFSSCKSHSIRDSFQRQHWFENLSALPKTTSWSDGFDWEVAGKENQRKIKMSNLQVSLEQRALNVFHIIGWR